MPHFKVFSAVDVTGEVGSQELWKFRGTFLADSGREAIMQVSDVDALEASAGDEKVYAATRESSWEKHSVRFKIAAEPLQEAQEV